MCLVSWAVCFTLSLLTFTKSSFACKYSVEHNSGVVKVLNVTVRSEGANDPGRTASTSGRAYIKVNGKNYALQSKGFNVAAFDALSGRFFASATYNCFASQGDCDKIGTFVDSLPKDSIILVAIQESGATSSNRPPSSKLQELGSPNIGSVVENMAYALIGYKGNKTVDWKQDLFKGNGSGPAEIAAVIPIQCSYMPSLSTTCSPFNVAAKKYGGNCLNESSSSGVSTTCKNTIDENVSSGWESAPSGTVGSFIKIDLHTIFTINKLRIMQNVSGRQIKAILMEFSDCSYEKILLAANKSDFQEFTFLSRQAKWIKFTVNKVYGDSGAVGIKEIEIYNELCNQKTICDVVQLKPNMLSFRYRLFTTKFPLMIHASDKVHVLLTNESRASSSRYEIIIGSAPNKDCVLKRIENGTSEELMRRNIVGHLRENETLSFWIEVEKERLLFGSGEQVYLYWRDAKPIKIKYAFFLTNSSAATLHICGRTDQCYMDAAHYWPLDKPAVRDFNNKGVKMGKILGTGIVQKASLSNLGFAPLALALDGVSSWLHLGDFPDSCISDPLQCPDGVSLSFKMLVSGYGTGYLFSSAAISVYYNDTTVHFALQVKEKLWEVKSFYRKFVWQTVAMSWSRENGLNAVILGDGTHVLRDTTGRTVTPSTTSHTAVMIGRPTVKNTMYAEAKIRDVALWTEELPVERSSKLHSCNDPDICVQGWEYFDGSCYRVSSANLSASRARNACLVDAADLVKITSMGENSFVHSLILGEVWIGLEQDTQGGAFHWKDGAKVSFRQWSGSRGSNPCVVMDVNGDWKTVNCSNNAPKYVCEKAAYNYLGCYQDNPRSPAFIFNPGGYKPSHVTPGLCMHTCGYWYFTYAAVKQGNLCLCSNSTLETMEERASDMCSVSCFGSGDQKCGGYGNHLAVYTSVDVWPLSLRLSSDASAQTLLLFNITFTPILQADHVVEAYTAYLGDGNIYHTSEEFASFIVLEARTFDVRGKAIVKHSKTGHRSEVESYSNVTALSNVTGLEVFCPTCAPINMTVSCSVKFRYGSDVDALVKFENREVPFGGSLPDAALIQLGTAVGESGSLLTSDGLYLLAGMDASSKGKLVALQLDLDQGGSLEIQVFRPKCVNAEESYCRLQKMCVANSSTCTAENVLTSCVGNNSFSLFGGRCTESNLGCRQNHTMDNGNFDFEKIAAYMAYTTSGPKRILLDTSNQSLQLEPGDVFGVRFPSSGPAASLKTTTFGSSLFFASSIINGTNCSTLRGNRYPWTEESPVQVSYAPAVAFFYSVDSESIFENVFQTVGDENVLLSIGNSMKRKNDTKHICLQQNITGLQLYSPEALPFAESVNFTVSTSHGSNVTYFWDFGDQSNATSLIPWVTHLFNSTVGSKTVTIITGNDIGIAAAWCSVVIQERITGLHFENTSLLAIENGTTARIRWILFHGSHVDFNLTITYPDGSTEAKNLTNAKQPAAIFFGMYVKNLTQPGWHRIEITATNKVNNETLVGNLSVQREVYGVVLDSAKILETNQTFNFTISQHQGDEVRYRLNTSDGKVRNTTEKVIPHVYTKAGRYRPTLITFNDISSVVVNCAEIIVQDLIEGLEYTSFNHTVAVRAEAEINWRLTQGSELYIIVDYGDGNSTIVNRSISVGDVFVAISRHNYTKPGEYHVTVNVTNLVDSEEINTTVYVETPGDGAVLAIRRGNLATAGGDRCTGVLYVAVNDSVTAKATIRNGTNVNGFLDFGDNSSERTRYFHREFPDGGWTVHHSYSRTGEYNITVIFSNRNPKNDSHTCRIIVQNPVNKVMITTDSPRKSSESKITFNISFPGSLQPSGPLNYIWRYGVQNITPEYEVRDNRVENYRYPSECGVYIATVNVSNEVSFGFAQAEVVIQDEVKDLNWTANYTELSVHDCIPSLPKNVFPFDYNVSFNASANGTNVTYTWSFPGNENKTGSSSRHKFVDTGKNNITLTAENAVSRQTVVITLELEQSILDVSFKNDGPSTQNRTVNFTLTAREFGNNSCFQISSNQQDKAFYFKTGKGCDGQQANNLLRPTPFEYTYYNVGEFDVTLDARNRISCVEKVSKVAVARSPCKFPIIEVPGFDDGGIRKFMRSDKIIIKTNNKLDCFSYERKFEWTFSCEKNMLHLPNVNLSRPEIIILPRTLDYCSHLEARFLINMTQAPGVYSEKTIVVSVTESPLNAIIDGGSEKIVGNKKPVKISAGESYDPDSAAGKPMDKNCSFAWFCRRKNDNFTLPENFTQLENSILAPVPTPPAINVTGNDSIDLGGCFRSGPGRLNFTTLEITLDATKMKAGTTYNITFVLGKRGRKLAYAHQVITIKDGDPPILNIKCIKNCAAKVNPATKMSLRGAAQSSGNKKISEYKWTIKECLNNKDNCKDVSKDEYTLPKDMKQDFLIIPAGFFKGGRVGYKVVLEGGFHKSEWGMVSKTLKVNEPPTAGNCVVKPAKGEPLAPKFNVSCEGFQDVDKPLSYEFFYSMDNGATRKSLGNGFKSFRAAIRLPYGDQKYDYMIKFFVKVADNLGAVLEFGDASSVQVKKKNFTVEELTKTAGDLEQLSAGGNVNEAASLVLSLARVLDTQGDEAKENITEIKKKCLDALLGKDTGVSEDMDLKDLAQVFTAVAAVTNKTEDNTLEMNHKLSDSSKKGSDAILKQAKGGEASSEQIEECAKILVGTTDNVLRAINTSREDGRNMSKTARDTLKNLTAAVGTTLIPGEEEKELSSTSITAAVCMEKLDELGNKSISLNGTEAVLPSDFSSSFATNSIVQRVSMVSNTSLFASQDQEKGNSVKSLAVSLSFSDGNHSELNIKNLTSEISIIIPRNDKERRNTEGGVNSKTYQVHSFTIEQNASTVHIRAEWEVSVDLELYVRKGGEPKPLEGVYDFNGRLQLGSRQSVQSSTSLDPSGCELFLSNDALNWTAAGTYYVLLRYVRNDSLSEEEKAKIPSDDTIPYTFSVYTSMCLYYDVDREVWSTEGTKVGLKTNRTVIECLTNHLTTFGSNFFVPPNKINFKGLSFDKLLKSPLALITACVILGVYIICLIPARRADRNDALKTGVSLLPDNDSRDTYCYEIHVHTGFARGGGTSAEVSIVLTGGLGDSEPRVLKDNNRKNFKTGSVDPFLLTVPQSLGSLKHIRIWHNNSGNYPSWNLLRVMIQDIQTDQRWWFVCDDWLAVDESDGKVERILYPASKKELTKFNVLFASEVRKNLTDGHIWFSVVARPPRSTFTRVQRLTCCLSVLMCTMVSNAMYYKVGENQTPQNAIRIMGFSFSIRQVSIGIVSSVVVFPVNLIIVTIFRKARPKANRYTAKPQGTRADDVDIEAAEDEKKPVTSKQPGLPHWFVYIAYGLAFVATCASASFVVMYGMEFGPEKSAQWLMSMSISFLQDVLLNQPIKVFALATFFAVLVKDPNKAEQDSLTDANALANDEEWLHKTTEDLDLETQQELKQLINDKPPNEAKLEIARKLRMKEKQMKSIIREVIWYVIFLLVLLTISYGNRDLTTSKVTRYMSNIFEKAAYSGNLTYGKVHEIHHYWKWLNETFIPSLMPQLYYDNLTAYDKGFVADVPTAWVLSVARLRQLRIKKDTCTYKRLFLYFIKECNDFYSIAEQDQNSFLPGWKPKRQEPHDNASSTPTPTTTVEPTEKGPWDFQTAEELKTYPYWGYKATYSAGGYVQVLPNDLSESLKLVRELEENNWLDRYTRAIFSEFAVYNANINLFCVVTLLFEQLPTGSLTAYPSILTLRLFRYVGGEMYFVLTCEIVYLLFCAFFVFKEIRMSIKKGREHLRDPWSILEIVLTLLSLSAVGLYFTRMKFTGDALQFMREDRTGFVSFHYTAFLDEWLKCIIGVIVFLSFLKMFRLLRFNRRMSMLQQVLKRCIGQLVSFMFMFSVAFLAFALLASLVFGQYMAGFGTFWRSCASLMDTLLGKFTLQEMKHANRIIAQIFFYTYTISMVFILLNVFISIINDAFTEVRSDVEKQSNEYEIMDFMIHRLKENIGKSMGHAIHPIYKEPKSDLEVKFDKIVDNADNAIHFMRNIAFEDMRKTRWFQTESCTDKKKNLIRLLMEVDWDFYESELCDSIPVFERFLSQYTEEELEEILKHYQQKRMVEDLVFEEVNGRENSSDESDCDSENIDNSDTEDNQSSNDESGSENEAGAEDGITTMTPTFGITDRPGSAVSVKSPAFLIAELEITTEEQNENADSTIQREGIMSPRETVVEEAAPEAELLKILDDVRRDQESRCATDAELDSILSRHAPVCDAESRTYNSDMEIEVGKKKKRKAEKSHEGEAPEENPPTEAWVPVDDKKGNEVSEDGSDIKIKKKRLQEELIKRNDVAEEGRDKGSSEENVKTKKKGKRKENVLSGDEKENKKDISSEINDKEETILGEVKLKKKKKVRGEGEIEKNESAVGGGGKKKKGMVSAETGEEIGDRNEEQKKKKKTLKGNDGEDPEAAEGKAVDETKEKPNKKKKKKAAAGEENVAFEKDMALKQDEETLEKELGSLDELFAEILELGDVDHVKTKRGKKRKTKMKLAQEDDDEQILVKSGETEESVEKETPK
ncbi:polycystin-1-like [Montipora foliosa]|uniref:polycystin-1-like n=1 Tax=Montipora foliosa TaxID=591990 RepID=UPI0035F12119